MLGVLRMDEMQEWERRDQRSRVWDWVRCLGVYGPCDWLSHSRDLSLGKEAFAVPGLGKQQQAAGSRRQASSIHPSIHPSTHPSHKQPVSRDGGDGGDDGG